ncbi:hypothetical protein GWI33_006105 [Rhynchophorus ferrugineus]|uniref:Kinesin-like protein n=1 Tax=Rhynchophorus ferrugineus TaxID=354439 RepID=A0A834IGM3_RHYFE|nr:hypothetical protein GWI33_006105 [Rhynchophorus ferrugineus]
MSLTGQSKKRISPTQNIKVVVRVRPLSKDEIEKKVRAVVSCVSLKEIQTKEKKYHFDRVFQPDSSQMDVYSYVVAPMITDVLEGYNCTVFAYGQTGTGKTHTMTGGDPTLSSNVHWKNDELAGCIPRAAANIFDEIGLMDAVDFNVRVSFLELYNEEVRDLLSEEERPSPLNLFNDSKGSVYIQGLNEITVFSSQDIYGLLQKGTHKRQTASTLMNNHSSRSHTVFTITVHIREVTLTGEDVLKTGKVNLVDLAGSENIAKSGAKDKRAQELANINRSLLTLGRVIQILAEKNNKHVPYRDSKLTRILQDSLGGNTKTCIIATVSPSSSSYEETQSTLEYACRARDIRNTPTVNEKVTKTQMIKDMGHEIEKLKRDLEAARTGTGVYIDKENWEQLNTDIQATNYTLTLKNEVIEEMKKKVSDLEIIREKKIKEFDQVMNVCKTKDKIIDKAKTMLSKMNVNLKQEQYVSEYYAHTATETSMKAKELFETTKKLSSNQDILQKKLENQYYNNYTNEKIIKEKGNTLSQNIAASLNEEEVLRNITTSSLNNLKLNLDSIKIAQSDAVQALKLNFESDTMTSIDKIFTKNTDFITEKVSGINTSVEESQKKIDAMLGFVDVQSETCKSVSTKFKTYNHTYASQVRTASDLLSNIYKRLKEQRQNEEKVLQDLERFTDITKNRIQELDFIINAVDNSNVLKETDNCLDEQRADIEQGISEIQRTTNVISDKLKENRISLDSHRDGCLKFESELISSCEEIKEHIVKVEKNNLDVIQSHSIDVTTKVEEAIRDSNILMEQIDTHLTTSETLLKNMDNIINQDIMTNIIPVKRGGDTPKQNALNLPKRVGEGTLPRDVLVKRFKEEFSKNVENESFHLNISTDSILPLEDDSINSIEDHSRHSESLNCSNKSHN